MDLVSFFIGIVLCAITMQANIRNKIIRFIMSLYTSFFLLKIKYPNLELWSMEDYFSKKSTLDSQLLVLIKNGVAIDSIFCSLFIYFSIFFFTKFQIRYYIKK